MSLADIAQAAGLRTPIRHQLFIGGQFVDALSGETLATLNPHDNSAIAEVALAGARRRRARGRGGDQSASGMAPCGGGRSRARPA